MISIDFDLLMEDSYSIEPDLLKTIMVFLENGVNVYMDHKGRVFLNADNSLYSYLGDIKIKD